MARAISDANSSSECYGRTDGRTNEELTNLRDQLQSVTPTRAYDEIARLGDPIRPGGLIPGDRHPVIRSGDREPIAAYVRSAVWYRDRGRCQLCPSGTKLEEWHLDHVTPWSAGGSDETTNLRVLCRDHNLNRSNYVDATERAQRPATWWCLNCFADRDDLAWWYMPGNVPVCPRRDHVWNATTKVRCNVTRPFVLAFHGGGEPMANWHDRPPIYEPDATTVAFCAHCMCPALTDQPL